MMTNQEKESGRYYESRDEPNDSASCDVVFACLARNCKATIANLFVTMENLRGAGVSCAAIIGENGSTDGTRQLIIRASTANVRFIDTSLVDNIYNRLEKMARARECVRCAVVDLFPKSRFVCVADLDNVMTKPLSSASIAAALSCLTEREDIFAVSATSFPWYYDLLAYRSESMDFFGLEAKIRKNRRGVLQYYAFHRDYIYPFQRQITKLGTHLCESAFNGICVYRTADYIHGSYVSGNDFKNCEHLAFNDSVGKNSNRKMLVLTDIAIDTPPDHGPSNIFAFYWRRTLKQLRKNVSF
jgi:hypothetical protein